LKGVVQTVMKRTIAFISVKCKDEHLLHLTSWVEYFLQKPQPGWRIFIISQPGCGSC